MEQGGSSSEYPVDTDVMCDEAERLAHEALAKILELIRSEE